MGHKLGTFGVVARFGAMLLESKRKNELCCGVFRGRIGKAPLNTFFDHTAHRVLSRRPFSAPSILPKGPLHCRGEAFSYASPLVEEFW